MIKEKRGKPHLKAEIGFALLHMTPLLALWTGATLFDWLLCISLYFGRMLFITGGYHRYFSHRTFQTSRAFQFVLAFTAQTSMQMTSFLPITIRNDLYEGHFNNPVMNNTGAGGL